MAAGGGERAARLRAIRGYGGLDQKELAPELGISVTTLSRMENGHSGISSDVLEAAARVCDVPAAFAQSGFARLTRPLSDVERRLYDIETKVAAVMTALGVADEDGLDAALQPIDDVVREAEQDAETTTRGAGVSARARQAH